MGVFEGFWVVPAIRTRFLSLYRIFPMLSSQLVDVYIEIYSSILQNIPDSMLSQIVIPFVRALILFPMHFAPTRETWMEDIRS